jgi:hypothetical protein
MTVSERTPSYQHPIAALLDNAGADMLALEEKERSPSELRVSAAIYRTFAHLRRRELDAGYPLLVLGATVVLDAQLEPDEFIIAP